MNSLDHDIVYLKEVLFHDFQKIRIMKCSESIKVKLLSALLSANPNCWRVVGITPNAMDVFQRWELTVLMYASGTWSTRRC